MDPMFPRFALGFLAATVALAEAGTAIGSERLTKLQMDTVSAGAVVVTSNAVAGAIGSSGYTLTRTSTYAMSAPNNAFQLGLGRASANACCGPHTAAAVSTDSAADGRNQSRYSVNFEFSTNISAQALGLETIRSDNRTGPVLSRPYPPP